MDAPMKAVDEAVEIDWKSAQNQAAVYDGPFVGGPKVSVEFPEALVRDQQCRAPCILGRAPRIDLQPGPAVYDSAFDASKDGSPFLAWTA